MQRPACLACEVRMWVVAIRMGTRIFADWTDLSESWLVVRASRGCVAFGGGRRSLGFARDDIVDVGARSRWCAKGLKA